MPAIEMARCHFPNLKSGQKSSVWVCVLTARSPSGILLEADEIIVKPFEVGRLTDLVREKMLTRRPTTHLEKERVGVILQRCLASIVEGWMVRAKQSK